MSLSSFPLPTLIFTDSWVSDKYSCPKISMHPEQQIIVVAGWKQCKWKFHWQKLLSNPRGFRNTNDQWKSIREGSKVRPILFDWTTFRLNKIWSMRAKNTKSTCQHIVLLLSITMSCLLNWPHRQQLAIRPNSVGYSVHQSGLASIFPVTLLYYWNEDQIDEWGSDIIGHDNLSILRRNAIFCLAINHLGLHLSSQLPSGTPPSSLKSTNHHIWVSIIL